MKHLLLCTLITLFGHAVFAQELVQMQIKEVKAVVVDLASDDRPARLNLEHLDKLHTNLLDPSASGDQFEAVIASWTNFHEQIVAYLDEVGFNWGVETDYVKLFHRFYFNSDGTVACYIFKVFDEQVSEATRESYKNHLEDFLKVHPIDLKRAYLFAQCGKSSYPVSK